MKIFSIKINSFRDIKDATININEMVNFIVSDNNVGKTRVLEAINQFYIGKEEADIEITYLLNNTDKQEVSEKVNEIEKINEDLFTIHYINKKYMYNHNIDMKKAIASNMFGEIIYIPAVSNHENEIDISKTTTNISKTISKLLAKNESLDERLDKLNQDLKEYIKELKTASQYNFQKLNNDIVFSDVHIEISNKSFETAQILKNNLELKAIENGEEKAISQLGTGVQRNIVNSILKSGIDNKKFTVILYDEPETFLNVKLQRALMEEINKNKINTQYIISTHSPDIIYRNEKIFLSIIKLKKIENNNIQIFQYNDEIYRKYIADTNVLLKGINENYECFLKEKINETILAWWDRNRVNALFEDKVLLVEGPTEEIFVDLICKNNDIVYISTAGGKFSIPYLNILFNKIFGIEIICICDKDNEQNINHKVINEYIYKNIDKTIFFDKEFEDELKYEVDNNKRKPQIFLEKYFNNEISSQEIERLKQKILKIYNSKKSINN